MNVTILDLILLMFVGYMSAVLSLVGAVIGAYAVYKTKFGGESSLFGGLGSGDAGTVAGEYEGADTRSYFAGPEEEEDYTPPDGGNVDKIMQNMANRAKQARKQMDPGGGYRDE